MTGRWDVDCRPYEQRIARGCLSRGVRSVGDDEVPRARVTATASVRRELPRSRAGPGAEHTVVACLFGACRSFVSYIELLFIVLTVYCVNLYISCLQLICSV